MSTADSWPTTAPAAFSLTLVLAKLTDVGASLAPLILKVMLSEPESDSSETEIVNSSTTASASLRAWTLLDCSAFAAKL